MLLDVLSRLHTPQNCLVEFVAKPDFHERGRQLRNAKLPTFLPIHRGPLCRCVDVLHLQTKNLLCTVGTIQSFQVDFFGHNRIGKNWYQFVELQ